MCPLKNITLVLLQYRPDCIMQLCNTCSDPTTIFNNVLMCAKNKDLKRKVSWKCWMNTTKEINDKECSAFKWLTVWGTFEELTDEYVCDVLNMWQHLFHLEWQHLQFGELVEDLHKGEVVFVTDFAKNYNHQETDEPQSAHWDCMQPKMHPVVVYHKCHCGKTITDKIIHFTSDLKHDDYAVKEFERKTIEHLKANNLMIECIYEFNCPSQYKSKIPFRILSKSSIPIMRNYFCKKHGKSTADGLIGRTN